MVQWAIMASGNLWNSKEHVYYSTGINFGGGKHPGMKI